MYILGITSMENGTHDNSIALIRDNELLFAVSEERFTRIKHDRAFPVKSIKMALDRFNIAIDDIEYFAIAWPRSNFYPVLFSRRPLDLPQTICNIILYSPQMAFRHFKLSLTQKIKAKYENSLSQFGVPTERIKFVGHHKAHAFSAHFASGFSKSIAIAMDAGGPKENGAYISGAIYKCIEGNLELLEEVPYHSSIALFYSGVTVALGFKYGDGEGKTMGLAAYGQTSRCVEELRALAPYFDGAKWIPSKNWTDFCLLENRALFLSTKSGAHIKELIKRYSKKNVAAAAQEILEDTMVAYIKYLYNKYTTRDLVLSGGLFYNVKMNKRLQELKETGYIYIPSNVGDGGTAFGAAMSIYLELHRNIKLSKLETAALGPEFSSEDIESCLKEFSDQIDYKKIDNIDKFVAERIYKGEIWGWFQGRAEWGPRALGQRSVLADPRSITMKDHINKNLKKRDWFMPFAPSVLYGKTENYFLNNSHESLFMTTTFDVIPERQKEIVAAIHIDNTARPHMVKKEQNPLYYSLIEEFYRMTGIPVILNTSFNRHGLPIVNSPRDAVEHLIWGCVDGLAIGDFIVKRKVH